MPQNDDQLTTANWLHRQHDKIMCLLVHKCEGMRGKKIAYRYSYKKRHIIQRVYITRRLCISLTVTNKYQQLDTRFITASITCKQHDICNKN